MYQSLKRNIIYFEDHFFNNLKRLYKYELKKYSTKSSFNLLVVFNLSFEINIRNTIVDYNN